MQLTGDIELKHPLWQRADDELCSSRQLGIFNRLIDVYVLACAIGIKEDQVIRDNEIIDPIDNKSIGRNTHLTNEDIRCLMEFMLQNALIKSQTINLDRDERLKLAFDPDYSINKLSAASFLTGFANYGITKIFDHITATESLSVIDDLNNYFESLVEADYDELLQKINIDALFNQD